MPLATIMLIEGRSAHVKRQLIQAITDAIERTVEVPRESIRVILQEIPAAHWGVAGEAKGR